jgi:flagellar M-ring protein FliF
VAGIVHLIASSVPELNPKQVSVLDQSGNLLSAQHDGIGLDPQQLGYVQTLEGGFNKRILDILEPIVGAGNVRARVTADVDFSVQESTAETYKPNPSPDQAAIRSQSIHENTGGSGAQAQGVPGAASNQPGASAGQTSPGATAGKKESVVNYEVDKTIRHQKNPTGVIRRLSAAVVVNHRRSTGADGKVALAALSKEQMEQINALTREAMGFNKDRGDSLNVANAAFTTEELPAAAEMPVWRNPEYLALAKDVGKGLGAALLALYVLFGVIRPLVRQVSSPPRPAALPSAAGEATPALEQNGQPPAADAMGNPRLNAPRQVTQTDPKIVANVIRTWVAKE